MNRLRLCFRQAIRGNFKPARLFAKHALYGLTHFNCAKCGIPKGLNTRRLCHQCQMRNLLSALFNFRENA